MNYAHPFVKWAGGKKQLLPVIDNSLPDMKGIKNYIEPFVGGGAVLFHLMNNYQFENVYISDTNKQLITLYRIIREQPEGLIESLSHIRDTYIPSEDKESVYLSMRAEYNGMIESDKDPLKQSALLIALNRTGYNGLYRVNSKGYYNVPHGYYKNPTICDEENITQVSKLLQLVTKIENSSFENSLEYVDKNTFVYCDPPYRPLTTTSSFQSYTKNSFNDDSQRQLSEFARRVDDIGGKILISNSDPRNVNPNDTFFEEIYDGFEIKRVSAKRSINSCGNKRGNVTELLISNYHQPVV